MNKNGENKILGASGLVATVLNTKIEEGEKRIPDTGGLVITTVLTTKMKNWWNDKRKRISQ